MELNCFLKLMIKNYGKKQQMQRRRLLIGVCRLALLSHMKG